MSGKNLNENELKIVLHNFCKCMGKSYATALRGNGLFEITNGEKAEFITMFPNEEPEKCKLYSDVVVYKNKIIFVPGSAKDITIYDVENKSIDNIKLQKKDTYNFYNFQSKFSTAIRKGKYVYMLPETYPAIVKINCESWTVEYIDIDEEEMCFKKGIAVEGNVVLIPSVKANVCMQFNLETNEIIINKINNMKEDTGIWSICCEPDSGVKWMVAYPGPRILRTGCEENIIEKFPKGFNDYGFAFTMCFLNGDYLYVCPTAANMFIRIHRETLVSEEVKFHNIDKENSMFMYLGSVGNHCCFYRYDRGEKAWVAKNTENVFLNMETLEMNTCSFKIVNADEYRNSYMVQSLKYKEKVSENSLTGLNTFISNIHSVGVSEQESDIGKRIHIKMKEE